MTLRRVVTSASGSAPYEQLEGTPSNVPTLEIDDSAGDFYLGGTLVSKNTPSAPGGADTQVQFDDGGSFGGSSGFVYDKASGSITLTGTANAGVVNAATVNVVTVNSKVVNTVNLKATSVVMLTGLPSADPNVNGQIWTNVGVLMVSAG